MFLSFYAAIGCIVLAVPPVLIGAVAKSTSLSKFDINLISMHEFLVSLSIHTRLEYDKLRHKE